MLVIQPTFAVPSPKEKEIHFSYEPSVGSEILNNNKTNKFI